MELGPRLDRFKRPDPREYPDEGPMPLHLSLREQLVGAPRGHEPGVIAMLLEQQIGASPDLALVDHPAMLTGDDRTA